MIDRTTSRYPIPDESELALLPKYRSNQPTSKLEISISESMRNEGLKIGQENVTSERISAQGWNTSPSTLRHQARSCIGVSLVLLWALSPLGGQSALRLIGTTLNITDTESSIVYFDTDAPSQFSSWIALSPGSMNAVLDNFIPPGNSSFLVEPSYLELHCSNITTNPSLEPFNSTLLDVFLACRREPEASYPCPNIQNGTFQGTLYQNRSSLPTSMEAGFDPCGFGQAKTTWALGLDTFIDKSYWSPYKEFGVLYDLFPRHNLDQTSSRSLMQIDTPATQATLLFQSYNVLSQMYTSPRINYTQAYCKARRSYVESRVDCTLDKVSTNCEVTAQRNSQIPHASTNITHLSFPEIFRYMSSALPKANKATGNNGRSDLALYYIQNASNSVVNTNTHQNTRDITIQPVNNRSSSKLQEVYRVPFLWLGIFLLAASVLLIAALASVVFSQLTINPEILGYSSLLVRDSRYIALPPGGGTLDGIGMTNALKEMEVKIGVVERISEGVRTLGVGLKENVGRTVVGKNIARNRLFGSTGNIEAVVNIFLESL
ncbi:hypothetical protein BGZ60DRAFT_427415 [Tricladium varicosporioides]|nr:hypothetical protein BGZ60DRAFT_427415 [Hymenoscyphus varicosporioides]